MSLKNHKWILMPFCLVVGLVIVYAFVKSSQNYLSDYFNENSKELIGKNISLESLAEHLHDQRISAFSKSEPNSAFILVFWSTTCAPCLKDLPQLTSPDIKSLVVPINTDDKSQLEEAHRVFSSLVHGDLPFLHDTDRFLQKQLKVKYLPTHVFLDQHGTIIKHEVGAKPF